MHDDDDDGDDDADADDDDDVYWGKTAASSHLRVART